MRQSLFEFDSNLNTQKLNLPDADIQYVPQFIASEKAELYMQEMRASLLWRQDHIRVYGRDVLIPRLQAWYGDDCAQYTYSGLLMKPNPWQPTLLQLKAACEMQCHCHFNSVLANLYRDGNDSMGMHSDDEAELGRTPIIASLTFGASRTFKLKHKVSGDKHEIPLEHGSLLIMRGTTQAFWQHGINKTKRATGVRLNLTFRNIMHQKNEL